MSPVALASHSAAVLYGPQDIRIEDRTSFKPPRGFAEVRILATGLCGSDLHYYNDGRNGDFALRAPLVLGHEAAGIITAVGPNCLSPTGKPLRIGQRVAIEAGIPCSKSANPNPSCPFCSSGRYNLCKDLRFASSAKTFPHLDGTLQERMVHPGSLLWPLPESVSPSLGALAEPLSVVLHASRRASLQQNHSVLVLGAGTIGLMVCALAQARGAKKVVAVDINKSRLEFAKRNGFAEDVFCLPTPSSSTSSSTSSTTSTTSSKPAAASPSSSLEKGRERAQAALNSFKQQDGFDIVYECTGAEPCIQMAIHAAAMGGKVMLVGMGTRNITLPLSAAALREVDILGSFRYANTYDEAIRLLERFASECNGPSNTSNGNSSSGSKSHDLSSRTTHETGTTHENASSKRLPDLTQLITHRFPLRDTHKAFEMMRAGVDSLGGMVMKVVIGEEEED